MHIALLPSHDFTSLGLVLTIMASPVRVDVPFPVNGGSRENVVVAEVRPRREREFAARVTLWHQFRALFLKDLTLQSRSIGTSLCQLLTPIILICFAGIMQLILNHILKENGTAIPGSDAYMIPTDISRVVVCNSSNDSFNNPEQCRDEMFSFFDEYDWRELLKEAGAFSNLSVWGVNETEFLSQLSIIPRQELLFDLPMYYVGKSENVDMDLGNLTFTGYRSGFLGKMVPEVWYYNFSTNFTIDPNYPLDRNFDGGYNTDGPHHIHIPFFLNIKDRQTLNKRLVDINREYNVLAHSSVTTLDQYQRTYLVTPLSHDQYKTVLTNVQQGAASGNESYFHNVRPHGGIFIEQCEGKSDNFSLHYTMVVDDLVLYDFSNPTLPVANTSNELHRRNNIINMMSNAVYQNLTGLNDTADVAIATSIMPLPSAPMNITIDVAILLGGILYPFAASFLIPVFMAALVKDKFEKQLIMMEQNGLSRWTYWLVTYVFNFCLYTIIAVVIAVFSLAFQIRLFTQTNGLVLVLTFLLWGHAEIVLGFFFSNFFSRPRTATIVGYLVVIAGVVIALLVEGLQVFPQDKTPFPVYMLYPPFAFYRILQYLISACITFRCESIDSLWPEHGNLSLVSVAMLYLAGSTIALIFISIYLSYVLPGEYGVRKSPFFPLIAVYKGIRSLLMKCGLCTRFYTCKKYRALSPPLEDHVSEEEVEEDVQAEEDSLREGFPEDAPVVMFQLRKEYPGTGGKPAHVAVHSVSLAIQRDECFGLLGPNGAGKTTLISVLTGLYEPTSGTARIVGWDINTQIQEVHRHLGVCPQFDIQDANLTVEEHLLFYSRLKGVVWSQEKAVVTRALRQVNLFDARKRKSKALSGGMRRRLSVAMATIGDPDVLILDEPTTGLDPGSRRQVWEVIENVKEGRSVILTTHAMEEADHLCTRIGIMNFGKLRCLGTQTRLKARFGSGYQLQFHCSPGRVASVENFIQTHLPRAVHMETYADCCTYKLEKEDLVVSEIFQLFDSVKDQIGICDWGIKMTTLEDVFLNIVKHNYDTRSVETSSYCPNWLPCQCYQRKPQQE